MSGIQAIKPFLFQQLNNSFPFQKKGRGWKEYVATDGSFEFHNIRDTIDSGNYPFIAEYIVSSF